MMIFWLTCLVGYPRTSAPEPKFAIMSTKSRVANSEKWLKGKGPKKVIVRPSLFFVSDTMTRYDSILFYNR